MVSSPSTIYIILSFTKDEEGGMWPDLPRMVDNCSLPGKLLSIRFTYPNNWVITIINLSARHKTHFWFQNWTSIRKMDTNLQIALPSPGLQCTFIQNKVESKNLILYNSRYCWNLWNKAKKLLSITIIASLRLNNILNVFG